MPDIFAILLIAIAYLSIALLRQGAKLRRPRIPRREEPADFACHYDEPNKP